MKPIQFIAPTLASTPTDTLAKAMINNTLIEDVKEKSEIIENRRIFELSKLE